jgi:hypothetical protein
MQFDARQIKKTENAARPPRPVPPARLCITFGVNYHFNPLPVIMAILKPLTP